LIYNENQFGRNRQLEAEAEGERESIWKKQAVRNRN
jgi:hypothetical protein